TAAADTLEISGVHPADGQPDSAASAPFNSGSAGAVMLEAPHVLIDGGLYTGSAWDGRGDQGGGGGDIHVDAARDLVVRNSGVILSSTLTSGRGGHVDIQAGDSIRVESGGIISTGTGADGRGGEIALRAPRIEIANGGAIAAQSAPPAGQRTRSAPAAHGARGAGAYPRSSARPGT